MELAFTSLDSFGARAETLKALARFLVERKNERPHHVLSGTLAPTLYFGLLRSSSLGFFVSSVVKRVSTAMEFAITACLPG